MKGTFYYAVGLSNYNSCNLVLKGNPVQPLLAVIHRALTAIQKGKNFMIYREDILGFPVFVFKPNEPRPIYIQRNLCKEKIQLAAFVPRDEPEAIGSEKYLWLRRSQLFFLTDTQVRNSDWQVVPGEKVFS